jgi:hypothetical protein
MNSSCNECLLLSPKQHQSTDIAKQIPVQGAVPLSLTFQKSITRLAFHVNLRDRAWPLRISTQFIIIIIIAKECEAQSRVKNCQEARGHNYVYGTHQGGEADRHQKSRVSPGALADFSRSVFDDVDS